MDLVLSDFRLNDSNGVELLEWMKSAGLSYSFPYHDGYGTYPVQWKRLKKVSWTICPNLCRQKRCWVSSVDCWTVETERKCGTGFLRRQESSGGETSEHWLGGPCRQPVRTDTGASGRKGV